MKEGIWETKESKEYIISSLDEIDELILTYGRSLKGDDKWHMEWCFYKLHLTESGKIVEVAVSKEDYQLYNQLRDTDYRKTLNYNDFLEKYSNCVIMNFMRSGVLSAMQMEFDDKVQELILDAKFEAISKLVVKDTLFGLKELIFNFAQISEIDYLNEIQEHIYNSINCAYKD